MDPRRQLPSVDRLLAHPALAEAAAAWSRRALVGVVRDALDAARAAIGRGAAAPAEDDLAAACAARLAALARPRPRRVVNATGVVIHTNLGRAPLGPRARAFMELAATGYSNLEYDVAKGERGHRADHVDELLGLLFPGFAAHVVNNNAAALLLALSALAKGRDVLISRGELIEIGGSFRIPEIMECSRGAAARGRHDQPHAPRRFRAGAVGRHRADPARLAEQLPDRRLHAPGAGGRAGGAGPPGRRAGAGRPGLRPAVPGQRGAGQRAVGGGAAGGRRRPGLLLRRQDAGRPAGRRAGRDGASWWRAARSTRWRARCAPTR